MIPSSCAAFAFHHHLELRRQFDRQIGGLGPFEDSIDEIRQPPEGSGQVGAVAREITALGKLRPAGDRGNAILGRHRGDPLAVTHHRRIGKRDHGLAAQRRNGGKRFVELRLAADWEIVERDAGRPRRRLRRP